MILRGRPLVRPFTGWIEVYAYGHNFSGQFYHRGDGRSFEYLSDLDFIAVVNALLDDIGYPEPTHRAKVYDDRKRRKTARRERSILEDRKPKTNLKAEKPTFVVKIMQRQHSTWQGTVQWIEGGGEPKPFRSAIELMTMMDSVIGQVEAEETKGA